MNAEAPAEGDILVVDDEASVVEVVTLYLERDGFNVRVARDGQAALAAIREALPMLVILDIMLPGVNGLEIMRLLRDNPMTDVPVILLTARGQETDRIAGLDLGADDYVTKPFSPGELISRVKAVLRRAQKVDGPEHEPQRIDFGEISIDRQTRQVTVRGADTPLTATEFNLLWFLAMNPRIVFKRDQLLEKVWGFSEYVDPNTVTVHIRRLREKLERDPSNPLWLVTVWGVGYKFVPQHQREDEAEGSDSS